MDSRLDVNRMYLMYVSKCESEDIQPVSDNLFGNIFNTQYNLSFHAPKKDQFVIYFVYKEEKDSNLLTPEREAEVKEHKDRKVEARVEKEKD